MIFSHIVFLKVQSGVKYIVKKIINLKKGQAVLLKFKGKKYTSTIVEVYG